MLHLRFVFVLIIADSKSPLDNVNYVTFIELLESEYDQIPLGKNVTLTCKTNLTDTIQWKFNEENITDNTM